MSFERRETFSERKKKKKLTLFLSSISTPPPHTHKKKKVVFPIECWIKVFKPSKGVRFILRFLSVICAIVSAVCVVSSVKELGTEAKEFQLFSA